MCLLGEGSVISSPPLSLPAHLGGKCDTLEGGGFPKNAPGGIVFATQVYVES